MKNKFVLFGLLMCFITIVSSCSSKLVIPLQEKSSASGSIYIKPSVKIKAATVMVDGNIVSEKRRKVKSITVTNVADGNHTVQVTSASWYYKESVNQKDTVSIKSGSRASVLVAVPPYSTGYWIYCGGLIAATLILSVAGI